MPVASPHLLLVEDDPTLSQNIQAELSAEGFAVDVAFDGQIAEKMLRSGRYDCIVLDVNLPHKNGYQLAREFRSYNSQTPILMLTAFNDLQDRLDGFEAGADDYLGKPFYGKELLARVRVLLKRGAQAPAVEKPRRYQVRNLTLLEESKQVFLDGQPLELTPREYQILLLLIKAKGSLVSKKTFIKEIWGLHFDANTNTIEVYINFLRNKIDKGGSDKLIKTRVGYGYYIEDEIYET